MNIVDVTIIGGGPCGLFASFYAGLRGMSVRIIDSLPELGGQLTALYPEKYVYDVPGFPKVLAKDLAREMIDQGLAYNPEVILEDTAQQLVKTDEGYTIVTSKGLELPTKTIIIAAGAGAFSPTKVGVAREEELVGSGVHYGVRNKSVFEGKKIAIVGGGDSAMDWCMNLHDVASHITLVHRRDVFRAHEDSVQKVKEDLKIPLKLFWVVKELHGDDRLEGLTLENTQTKETEFMECDALCVNIGFKSSIGPLKEWGLEIVKNQIVVDRKFETCLPGVFACGDVCTFDGKLRRIATGVGEAATAVCYAKLQTEPGAKFFPGHSSEMDSMPGATPAAV
jgi:thioredoxin reductase (NADPH)